VLVLLLVGGLTLLTVVNFSFHDVFTPGTQFWVDAQLYEEVLKSQRFIASLGRSLLYSTLVLAIELPLGIYFARHHMAKGCTINNAGG